MEEIKESRKTPGFLEDGFMFVCFFFEESDHGEEVSDGSITKLAKNSKVTFEKKFFFQLLPANKSTQII